MITYINKFAIDISIPQSFFLCLQACNLKFISVVNILIFVSVTTLALGLKLKLGQNKEKTSEQIKAEKG